MSSSVVIGQPNPTSSASGSGPANLFSPTGVWSDGTILVVSDTGNNRVLIFNPVPTTDGESASVVIGQSDFSGTQANAGHASPDCATLNGPAGVFSDGKYLFIADNLNNRILIFNSIPTQNYAAADVVIGQPDCVSHLSNQGGPPAANTLGSGGRVFFDGRQLIVSDGADNRVMFFGR